MTRDEILNMPAGREMNALIEKHIFFHDTFEKEVVRRTSNANKRKDRNVTEKELWAVLTKYSSVPVRNYSTDISAAFEVMEKFSVFNFEFCRENDKGSACAIVNENLDNAVIADTVPLAICRAALLAVME
jgi:hypothetical protein